MNENERLRQLVVSQRRLSRCGEDVGATLRALADESFALTGGDGALVEIASRDGLFVRGATGALAGFVGSTTPGGRGVFVNRFPLHEAIFASVHRHESGHLDAFDLPACRTAGVRSIIAVPLQFGERTLGILSVISSAASSLGAADAASLQILAASAAAAVAREEDFEAREAKIAERTVLLIASLDRQNRNVQLLQEVATAANEAQTLESVIRVAMQRVSEHGGWQVGHLYLVSEDSPDNLLSTSVWHITNPMRYNALVRMTDAVVWKKGLGLVGKVFEEGRSAWVQDIRSDPRFIRTNVAVSLGIRSSFALPILIGSEVVGALEFFSEHQIAPDERWLDVMQNVGAQLGRVLERKRAQIALGTSERRYRLLFERNLAGVVRMKLDGTIVECNEAFAGIVGAASVNDVHGRSLAEMIEDGEARRAYRDALDREHVVSNTEVRIHRLDGAPAWLLLNLGSPSDDDLPFVEGTVLDITERKEVEAKIAYQAHHDPLTGLQNRASFIEQLETAMAHARRNDTRLGLLYIDLDEFKPINDSLGHAAGDALLREVASRLRESVRRTDIVGRMGGDEFIVLLNPIKHDDDAPMVADKTLRSIVEPFEHEGRTMQITASIGIAIYPQDGDDSDSFIAAADRTMYESKRSGKNRWFVSSGRQG
ncbi:MAG: diguanylate cyclase [Thermoanaerobaculia bacterium]|jgi:diguanylate cyclase (GGDEF)-like protein/PAS domain S-box-containing protein